MAEGFAQAVVSAPGAGLQTVQRQGAGLALPIAGAAGGVAAPLFINRAVDGATTSTPLRLGARVIEAGVGVGLAAQGDLASPEGMTKAFAGAAMAGESVFEFVTLPLPELGDKSMWQSTIDWIASLLPAQQAEQFRTIMKDGFRFGATPLSGGQPGKPASVSVTIMPKERKEPSGPTAPKPVTEVVALQKVARSVIPT